MTTIGLSYSLVKRSTKCAPALIAMPGSVVEQDGNWQCNLTNQQWQLRKGQKLPSQTHINLDDMLFWIME